VSVSVYLIVQYRWVRNVVWIAMERMCIEECTDQWGMLGR